jgi:signal transduction histidine kinase
LSGHPPSFPSSITHDIRNPLTLVRGTAQLLRRQLARPGGLDPARLDAGLETIMTGAGRMADQLDGVLDLARGRLGRPLELVRKPTDLVAMARDTVAEYQQATDRHRCVWSPPTVRKLSWWGIGTRRGSSAS